MHSITFNGVSSESLGIVVENMPVRKYPQRNYEVTSVPGRNGDLLTDMDSWANVQREYNVAMGDAATGRTHNDFVTVISRWLHSGSGYCELTDTFEPDYLRLAYYDEESSFSAFTEPFTDLRNQRGSILRGTIRFNCKPQVYAKSEYTTPYAYFDPGVINSVSELPDYWYSTGVFGPVRPILKFRLTQGSAGYFDLYNRVAPFERFRISWASDITIPTLPGGGPDRFVVDCERQVIYSEAGHENLIRSFLLSKFVPDSEPSTRPYDASVTGTTTYGFMALKGVYSGWCSGMPSDQFVFIPRGWIL